MIEPGDLVKLGVNGQSVGLVVAREARGTPMATIMWVVVGTGRPRIVRLPTAALVKFSCQEEPVRVT